MKRHQFVGYWVAWPYPFCDARAEQRLFEDGRFEAKIVADERLKVNCEVTGRWDLIDGAIQWTYETAKSARKPRKPQLDKVLAVEKNRFLILEGKGPQSTAYWRGVPSDDTSTNFDLEEVQPFLGRLRRLVDEGFAAEQIASAMTKIKNLQPQTREQIVFPIVFRGAASPFYLGVYMDDVDAPDICFSGPVELVRQIDDDIKKG